MAMTSAFPVAAMRHHNMIAKAAYYAAERRGFAPGFEVQDWLTAECGVAKVRPRTSWSFTLPKCVSALACFGL
jgi:hypothetical protein